MLIRIPRTWGRPRFLVILALAVVLSAGSSAIVLAVTSNPGPFTGCLTPKGVVYSVAASDTAPLAACKKDETQITFSNAAGPRGFQGFQGIPGPSGAPGIDGTNGIDGEDGLGPVVAAGRVGPLGGLTTPPQFGSGGVLVTHEGTGIYRLSFPGYDSGRNYVVSGSAVTPLDDAPRVLEVLAHEVGTPLDPSLGIFVRISSTGGGAIDSAFMFQVTDFSVAP